MINVKSKVPDHSILVFSLKLATDCASIISPDNGTEDLKQNSIFRKFDISKRPINMFNSELTKITLTNVINDIILTRETQDNIDEMYTRIVDIIIKEMNDNIPYRDFDTSKKCSKMFKNHKPYWNDELTTLWKNMHEKEKQFIKYKGQNRVYKNELRNYFILSRKAFDKKLRFFDRRYHRGLDIEIEELSTKNPKQFWNHIKKLGPKKKSII